MSDRQVDILARAAGEWLTFERLRQELLSVGANDPLLVAGASRDVEAVVRILLEPDRPAGDVRSVRFALLRMLRGHKDVIALQREDLVLAVEAQETTSDSALQALLEARSDVFAQWGAFQRGMQQVGPTLCQIRIDDKAAGTGFLISDRHVLTAFHVVKDLVGEHAIPTPGSHKRITAVFDEIAPEGKSGNAERVSFEAAGQWLVCSSEFDSNEDVSPAPLDTISAGRLDYAVICLAAPAGLHAPRHQKSTPRHWLDIAALARQPSPQAQMVIAHFPGGADLRLSIGLYDRHSTCRQRIRYRAPALHGSSGAPCFTVDWRPYALHNAGYDAVHLNQGVPLDLIVAAIGGLAVLHDAQVTDRQLLPAITADGDPIFGRLEIATQVQAMLQGTSEAIAMVVTSPPRGGKSVTADLLRSMIIDAGHRAFLLDAESFAADAPEAFARRLVAAVAGDTIDTAPPASPDSRQRARWISRSLSAWTRTGAAKIEPGPAATPDTAAAATTGRGTVWIIIDRCDVTSFSAEVQDLLVALVNDEEMRSDQPLRLLLLGYTGDLGVATGARVWRGTLDLFSVPGVLPFMRYTLAALGVSEPIEETRRSADSWLTAVTDVGVTELPQLATGLRAWANKRHERLATDASGATRE